MKPPSTPDVYEQSEALAAVQCSAWLAAERKRRSHRLCWNLISALAIHCAADEDKIIDLLTGYLFDEEEAGKVKAANHSYPIRNLY